MLDKLASKFNKSKVVQCCLYSYRQQYSSSQWSKWVHNKFWPLWWWISLSTRVQTMLNHFRFVFYHNIQCKEVFISEHDQNHDTKKEQELSITFSQYGWFIFQNECSWLAIALRVKFRRAWHEQCCLDSYWQQQISQWDCEITSNCGKKIIGQKVNVHQS